VSYIFKRNPNHIKKIYLANGTRYENLVGNEQPRKSSIKVNFALIRRCSKERSFNVQVGDLAWAYKRV
jgi:hypothetical protein